MMPIRLFTFLLILFQIGCTKAPIKGKRPPVCKAGNDVVLLLPQNSFVLDGSQSFDPDGVLLSYLWAKISGPSSFKLASPNSVKTILTNLEEGEYLFQLTVTDEDGTFASDTVLIAVQREGERLQFNHLPPVSSPCIITIPNINDQLPLIFSFEVYIRPWYTDRNSGSWIQIGPNPDADFDPSLPPSSYWYWYEINDGALQVHYPSNLLCDGIPLYHDLYILF